MRFITPLFMFAAAAYVWWYNTNHTDSVVMLPFIEAIVPSTKGDPAAQGQVSAAIFLGLGAVFFLRAIWGNMKESKLRRQMRDDLK